MHRAVQQVLRSGGAVAVLMAFVGTAHAQSLRISTGQVTIGAPLQGEYSIPEGDKQPNFAIGIRKKGQIVYVWQQGISGTGRGSMKLGTPNDPGAFEAVLYDSNKKIHSVKPFRTVVTSTPGALRADKASYIAGEAISISVRKEPNRFYGNGWVGLFHQGDQGDGGASIVDQRLTWQRIPAAGKQAAFRAPDTPGTYEFRLFDRDNWWYVLDRVAVRVTLPPTPGVMSIDKKTFTIGEAMTLNVALEPNRHYGNSWVGLFRTDRVAPGGGKVVEHRLTWQRVNLKTRTLKFTAPPGPGKYAFRLFDRDSSYYILDNLDFETIVPPTPGVMKLGKEIFTIGEVISLDVALVPGRHYGNSWVGLYRSATTAAGGATVERHRLTWQRANLKTKALKFTAPSDPGDYEFILFDRDGGLYQLDRIPFKTEAPPTPGGMALAEKTYTIGVPITLQVKRLPGRHYGNAWVGLFRKTYEAKGGAKVAQRRLSWQRVGAKTTALKFTAPPSPGQYEFKLYDRDGASYLLDAIDFETVVPPTPNVLSLNKDSFVTGEPLKLAVNMTPGRYYGSSWIGLYRKDGKTVSGAGIRYPRLSWQRANLKTRSLNWNAPTIPGEYEFRLVDGGNDRFVISSIPFAVKATPKPGILSVQKRRYRPGELVRVRITLPENRTLSSPWVELAHSSHALDGGAIRAEQRVRWFRVGKTTPALAFEAPKEEGPYELRFFDRGGERFILDIKPFIVVANPSDGLRRTAVRFTPMPGRRSGGLQPGSDGGGRDGTGGETGGESGGESGGEPDGLPGRPVRPDGTPTTDPDKLGAGGGEKSGGKDGDAADDSKQPANSENQQAGARPSLKFLAIGSDGLADISSIKRGQPFIIEARYAKPSGRETVTAEMSFGTGSNQSVVLHRADDKGLYRSGVIRLPAKGRN